MTTGKIVRVVSTVLDTKKLVVIDERGNTFQILQGSPALQKVLKLSMEANSIGKVADVPPELLHPDYEEPSDHDTKTVDTYKKFEEKSNGLVRFFQVSKKKIKDFFKGQDDGADENQQGETPEVPSPLTPTELFNARVSKVLQHATPVDKVVKPTHAVGGSTLDSNNSPEVKSNNTMIAVVEGVGIVQDVQALVPQIKKANREDKPLGVINLLKRMAAVANVRNHSAEDLMRFLERGNLPITANGDIIIYKILRRRAYARSGLQFTYVDCHTGNVSQRVGSLVMMSENLVDRNRNAECSNGLHVARMDYLPYFSGDVCVAGILRPEDVITVPSYDSAKMRVTAYHIVGELTQEAHNRVCSRDGKVIDQDTPKDLELIQNMLNGTYARPGTLVNIGGQQGSNITYSVIEYPDELPVELTPEPEKAVKAETLPEEDLPTPEKVVQKTKLVIDDINPTAVIKEVREVASTGRKQIAKQLLDAVLENDTPETRQALYDYKRSVKQGWDALGIPEASHFYPIAQAPAKVIVKKTGKPVKKVKPKAKKK